MSTPPDEPTRRLPPTQGPPPAQGPPPRVREREYAAPVEDDGAWLVELRDQISSLKTAVILLGVLSVVALALAAWALLSDKNDNSSSQPTGSGASAQRVSQLEDRVNTLESQVKDKASKSSVSDLRTQQKDLATRVSKLESSAGQQSDTASKQSVDQVSQNVQDLSKRVDDIERQQQQQANASPTP